MILNTPLEDLGMVGALTFSSEDHQFGVVKVPYTNAVVIVADVSIIVRLWI